MKRFAQGYLAYAGSGTDSRGVQLIVALEANPRLGGGSPWEVPWGELVGAHSYDTLAKIYTGYGEKPLMRTVRGVTALTGVSGAFGDVLSYLRLFALGLASASLAAAFNDMASDVRQALPGIGMLFALLILLLGHALNFLLSVASGFIHGLRLNVIEFFKWGVQEEGNPYRPFAKKESN